MDTIKKITVIGLGLLGGSMALALRKVSQAQIYGMDANPEHLAKALSLGIIDAPIAWDKLAAVDLVIVAVPVHKITEISAKVLEVVSENALVFDTGSIKYNICNSLASHPKREQFLAVHPIAGTEFSGPEAAFDSLFIGKKCILCDVSKTRKKLLDKALEIFNAMQMQVDTMDSKAHDKHIAYVSHLSHISSFMLGKTVLEIEKNEQNIFNMAGSGFASTVRLAKSSPATWTPIFIENKASILKALSEYQKNMDAFAILIENDDFDAIFDCMQETNYIGKILKHEF